MFKAVILVLVSNSAINLSDDFKKISITGIIKIENLKSKFDCQNEIEKFKTLIPVQFGGKIKFLSSKYI